MNTKVTSFLFLLGLLIFSVSCEKNEVFPEETYNCALNFPDSSAVHPNAVFYQELHAKYRQEGRLVGSVLLVKDKNGLWIGAEGNADIASNVPMKSCNTFLIASISKVFTAAAIYRYIDKGTLGLEDQISQWLDKSIVENVENADEAKIKHLLSHTSGVADFYTTKFDLDRHNVVHNDFTKEKVLKYIYGKKATNGVGETYYYSNTNFLLLSLILEKASGLSFGQVYEQEVFAPLALSSAYYSEEQPIPNGTVKGYIGLGTSNNYFESRHLYQDELGIGGDGGVAINAHDLAVFFEEMMKGNLISQTSLSEMTNWFDLPSDWHAPAFGHTENGFGIEKFNTEYGVAVGHSGLIDGFITISLYFPEQDMTFIHLINSIGNQYSAGARYSIYQEVLQKMFE